MDRDVPVQLFWTGGWDSTFQLLRLLLDQRAPVVPYYLLRDRRTSTTHELEAMERIRAAHGGSRRLSLTIAVSIAFGNMKRR